MLASIRSLALATTLLAAPATALAQDLTAEQRAAIDDFVLASSTFVLFHEIGHMLSLELDIPVLGREEDVADAIAAIVMLSQRDEEDYLRAVGVLEASITSFMLVGAHEFERILTDEEMADPHSLKRQRAYQMICFMYGADAGAFAETADRYGLSGQRREDCAFEYERAARSLSRVLEPHAREEGGPAGAPVPIAYEETDTYAHYASLLRENETLEEISEALTDAFVLPREVNLMARECGLANAMFDIDEHEVVFCYELAGRLGDIYTRHVLGIEETGARTAQPATPEQIEEADRFAVSDAILTMFHEAGHMLVGELNLPVLGREEDATDAIATIVLLRQDEDRDLAIAYLEDAIEGWFRRGVSDREQHAFARLVNDSHSLSDQRGYQIACFMYGSDGEEFEYVADRYAFSEDRREYCEMDYALAERSWQRLLAPHIRETGDEPVGRITIEYEAAETLAYFADLLKQDKVLEELAESLEEAFILPRDIRIYARECDWVNAYYDPETGDMVLCYELVESERQAYLAAVFGVESPGL